MEPGLTPNRITIHCTATPNGQNVSVDAITKDHITKGFGGIGYHALIQPDGDGSKRWLRALNWPAAHVKGHNKRNIGIALAGTDKFTRAQFDGLRNMLDALHMTYDIPTHEIWCHYEFDTAVVQGKTCPSIRAANLIAWYYEDDWEPVEKWLLEEKRSWR